MIDLIKAEQLACKFLAREWHIPPEHQEWFTSVVVRSLGEEGYEVEVGIDGFPDRWIVEVYHNGKCESDYQFFSPIQDSESYSDLEELPPWIAQVLMAERKHR